MSIIKTTMRILALTLLGGGLLSCQEHNEFYETDKTCPIKSVTVSVQGEDVVGEIDDHYVNLYFQTADSFSAASITLDLVDGYELTFPEDPSLVDLTKDAVLIFKTPAGQIKKYFFNIDYAKSMIVDASKITVYGTDAALRISDISGTFVLSLNPSTMDQSNIELTFSKGSLVEGAKVSQKTFDFSKGLVQTFYIYTSEVRKKFTFTLDVSSCVADYRKYDLADQTTMFVSPEDAEHIQIWTGNAITNVPVRNIIKTGGDLKVKGTYVAETPFCSNYGCEYTDPTIYGTIGDWDSSRLTENITGIDIGIVLMDADFYAAKLNATKSNSMAVNSVGATVAMTGMPCSYPEVVWADGKAYKEEMLEFAPGTFTLDKREFYRPALTVFKDGSIDISTVAWDKGKKTWNKWDRAYAVSEASTSKVLTQSSAIKNEQGIATFTPLCVIHGHKLNNFEVLYGSSEHWEPAFGQAWNGARMRGYVGRTFDNKIGIAVFNIGDDASRDPSDSRVQREAVVGTFQAAWFLASLGWSDVLPIETSFYLDEDFAPTILVNGKVVSGKQNQKASYILSFDKK